MDGIDSYFVREDLDDGTDRIVWVAKECPLADQCSKSAWHRANVWSFLGEAECKQKAWDHLAKSALHPGMDQDEAEMLDVEIEEQINSWEDREAYRKQLTKHWEANENASGPKPSTWKKGGKDKKGRAANVVKPMNTRRISGRG